MSTYISIPREDARDFIYHAPTFTLAEILFNAGPAKDNILRVASDLPPPDDAFTAFAERMHQVHPLMDRNLAIFSRADLAATLPEHLILADTENGELIIHYPAFDFHAGIREDGTKIPPAWKDPAVFTPEQRRHFLAAASHHLMAAIARHATGRQAT